MEVSNLWFNVFLRVYLKKASIAQMSASDVYSSLDRIHSVDEEDAEDSDSSLTITELGNYLIVLTHACTTFKSERIQTIHIFLLTNTSVVRIDGPVYLSGVEESNPGASRARSAVVQQIMDVAEKSQNKVPVPQNIEFVSSYEASATNGIYALYFHPPSGRSIGPELQTAFQGATAGFSNDSVVQGKQTYGFILYISLQLSVQKIWKHNSGASNQGSAKSLLE
ncbi:hypothetical protein CRM22_002729 [Opisthorchis felineus]|uniref:Uncharacterized protein n=1 Tax=Opisthorchis felineus TaxID=147828 RepID=A0A4S2M554_OPIFE|nr:hypothetical protein CRM22_002729 [Opisthorchis felineus]